MSDYPEIITPGMLPKWAHIGDDELARDIADTEREIYEYERTREAELALAQHHPSPDERRMADFKAGARPGQIEKRRAFVAFLRRIQAARIQKEG